MTFRVEILPEALANLDEITTYIAGDSSREQAERWLNSILAEIATLAEMPGRCALAPEAKVLGRPVRVLLHGPRNRAFRIYFEMDSGSETVRVLHIRRGARGPWSGEGS
jgi:plasmid stabilization system protein ParE